MTNKERIQSNNANLREAIDMANDLPDAGGGDDSLSAFLAGTLEEINDDVTTELRQYTFYTNDGIKRIRFTACTTIASYALRDCTNLESVDFPVAKGTSGAYFCTSSSKLTSVNIPEITTIGNYGFQYCTILRILDLPKVTSIGTYFLRGATAIETLILRASRVSTLGGTSLVDTPIEKGTGFIYVPSTLLESYKSATNWSAYAEQFRAIEDYPEITGG